MSVKILNEPMQIPLSARRKDLMHKVMDGRPDLVGAMHIFHHYKFCDNFLIWLVAHGYVGADFVELLVKQFKGSVPELINYIVGYCKSDINTSKV